VFSWAEFSNTVSLFVDIARSNRRRILGVDILKKSRRGVLLSTHSSSSQPSSPSYHHINSFHISSYVNSMYSSTRTSLPPLSLHLGNLPGFEFSSDRETPISNPPSGVFTAHSSVLLPSTSISPLNLLSATPINRPTPICQRNGQYAGLQRASTFPMASLPPINRQLAPPTYCQLPEGFQRCSFVDSLVG